MLNESLNQNQESPGNWGQNKQPGFWSKYKLAVIIGIMVLIIVAVVCFLLVRQSKQPTPGPQPGQQDQKTTQQQAAPLDLPGSLSLAPSQLNLKVGDEFSLEIIMNTNGYNISAVSAVLKYDEAQLEVIKIDTSQSPLSLSVEKKAEAGQIRVARGQPADGNYQDSDDGYTGSTGVLAKVIFKTRIASEGKISFVPADSKLILDDGRGTEMKMELGEVTYIIE